MRGTLKNHDKKLEKRIEAAYYAKCCGIQISIMDIGKVFAHGRNANADAIMATGAPLDDASLADSIRAFVETIRAN